MKKFFPLLLLISCNIPTNKPDKSSFDTSSMMEIDTSSMMATDTSLMMTASTSSPQDAWNYSTQKDKMDDKDIFFAQTQSINTLYFNAPYDGGSYGELTIRKMNGRNEVILDISQGQFLSTIGEYRTVRLRFDDNKPITVGYNGTSDYRSNEIFLDSPALIISKLKKTKKLLLEVEFYEVGRQQLEFNVANFDWQH